MVNLMPRNLKSKASLTDPYAEIYAIIKKLRRQADDAASMGGRGALCRNAAAGYLKKVLHSDDLVIWNEHFDPQRRFDNPRGGEVCLVVISQGDPRRRCPRFPNGFELKNEQGLLRLARALETLCDMPFGDEVVEKMEGTRWYRPGRFIFKFQGKE